MLKNHQLSKIASSSSCGLTAGSRDNILYKSITLYCKNIFEILRSSRRMTGCRKTLPTTNHKLQTNSGFTLVELAIVIVIIGLLIAGVIQGQELITQGKNHAQVRQFAEYNSAAMMFKSKFNNLPGDVPTAEATTFGFSVGSALGGNGKLEDFAGNIPNVFGYWENRLYFVHLSEKLFIKDRIRDNGNYLVGRHYPQAKINSVSGIAAVGLPDGIYYFLGPSKKVTSTNDHIFSMSSPTPPISPSEAVSLDSKIDDGIPSQGKIRAITINDSATTNFSNDTNLNNCLGITNQSYNLYSTDMLCRLIIKAEIN